jgi:hypothetical protein
VKGLAAALLGETVSKNTDRLCRLSLTCRQIPCRCQTQPAWPFTTVEGLFTVLMGAHCQAARGHGAGPYPVMTRAQMRAGLDLPT